MKNTIAISYTLDQKDNNLQVFVIEYNDLDEIYEEIDEELQPVLNKIKQLVYVLTNESHYKEIDNLLFIKYGFFK